MRHIYKLVFLMFILIINQRSLGQQLIDRSNLLSEIINDASLTPAYSTLSIQRLGIAYIYSDSEEDKKALIAYMKSRRKGDRTRRYKDAVACLEWLDEAKKHPDNRQYWITHDADPGKLYEPVWKHDNRSTYCLPGTTISLRNIVKPVPKLSLSNADQKTTLTPTEPQSDKKFEELKKRALQANEEAERVENERIEAWEKKFFNEHGMTEGIKTIRAVDISKFKLDDSALSLPTIPSKTLEKVSSIEPNIVDRIESSLPRKEIIIPQNMNISEQDEDPTENFDLLEGPQIEKLKTNGFDPAISLSHITDLPLALALKEKIEEVETHSKRLIVDPMPIPKTLTLKYSNTNHKKFNQEISQCTGGKDQHLVKKPNSKLMAQIGNTCVSEAITRAIENTWYAANNEIIDLDANMLHIDILSAVEKSEGVDPSLGPVCEYTLEQALSETFADFDHPFYQNLTDMDMHQQKKCTDLTQEVQDYHEERKDEQTEKYVAKSYQGRNSDDNYFCNILTALNQDKSVAVSFGTMTRLETMPENPEWLFLVPPNKTQQESNGIAGHALTIEGYGKEINPYTKEMEYFFYVADTLQEDQNKDEGQFRKIPMWQLHKSYGISSSSLHFSLK